MNALAQNVTKLSKDYEALKKKCRQQQAEIEALKRRELTDDEIDELENQFLTVEDSLGFPVIMGTYEFAKAILRKAQER